MPEIMVCGADEVHGDAVVCKRIANVGQIAVARVSDGSGYVAFEPHCPHAHGPLAEGKRVGDVIVCPWHFFRFDLRTGKPPGVTSILELRRYPVTVRDNFIFVQTE